METSKIAIDAQQYTDAIAEQRNVALNDVAVLRVALADLRKENATLRAKLEQPE